MMVTGQTWFGIGALSAFIAVAAGAFAAHGLAPRLEPKMLEVFRTAAQYQMYHALALLVLGLWIATGHARWPASTQVCAWFFFFGTIVFSGSLYALALTGVRWLGAITPIGGLLFLAGWLTAAASALIRRF